MWKLFTLVFIGFLLVNSELVGLAMFIDVIGLDLFLMLLEVQLIAVFGFYFNSWFKPILLPIYKKIQKLDPYFFIPKYQHVKQLPALFCHAIPGFMLLIVGGLVINQDSGLV
ncbi:hypothetical protein K0H80_14570 [Shewanella aegiceratis]|nr:hypothetical protein K0H80_14570 [Shewanella aegiceratis]